MLLLETFHGFKKNKKKYTFIESIKWIINIFTMNK